MAEEYIKKDAVLGLLKHAREMTGPQCFHS